MQRTHRPTSHKKDPMKQYQGAVSRAQGKHFEAVSYTHLDVYKRQLIEYALNDTEPTISGVPKSCFAFVKPVLDRSKARAEAGRKGGKSKREANSKQNGSNSKQPGSKPEAIKDKGRDKGLGKDKQEDEEDNPPYPPSGDDVGQPPESPGVDPDFSEEEPPRPRRRKPSTLSKTQRCV